MRVLKCRLTRSSATAGVNGIQRDFLREYPGLCSCFNFAAALTSAAMPRAYRRPVAGRHGGLPSGWHPPQSRPTPLLQPSWPQGVRHPGQDNHPRTTTTGNWGWQNALQELWRCRKVPSSSLEIVVRPIGLSGSGAFDQPHTLHAVDPGECPRRSRRGVASPQK